MSKIVSFWILHSWFQGTGSLPVRLTWRVMLLRSSSSFIRSAVQPSSHAAKKNKKACSKITVDEEGVTKYELSMQTLNRKFFKKLYKKQNYHVKNIFAHIQTHLPSSTACRGWHPSHLSPVIPGRHRHWPWRLQEDDTEPSGLQSHGKQWPPACLGFP